MSPVSLAAMDSGPRRLRVALEIGLALLLVYAFLVSVGLLTAALQAFGEHADGPLFGGLSHPLAGLSVGMLVTLLVQSSAVTTSLIVALSASGELPLGIAVPMVMGANLGATVANGVFSLGSARHSGESRRALACTTVHDVFNVCAVLVLLPLELATGWIESAAAGLAGWLSGGAGAPTGAANSEPFLAGLVGDAVQAVRQLLEELGAHGALLSILMLVLGAGLVHLILQQLGRTLQRLLSTRLEASLVRVVQGQRLGALAFGVVATVALQSSTITSGLLSPLVAASMLSLETAYPVTVGANIGSTATALLASLAIAGPLGLAAALVHVLFNLAAALLMFGVKPLRGIPVGVARRLAVLAGRRRMAVLIALLAVFVALPLAGMLTYR